VNRERTTADSAQPAEVEQVSMSEIFWYFLKLGWLAFGGPIGQIGLMHLEVVERRKWLDEDEFIRALNFCHLLPGPEALQLAIYVRLRAVRRALHERVTVALGLAAFAALTWWMWRLNVVAVVLAGGVLGLFRAFAPELFGGALS